MSPVDNALTDQVGNVDDLRAPELGSNPEKNEREDEEIVEDVEAGDTCSGCYFCGVRGEQVGNVSKLRK